MLDDLDRELWQRGHRFVRYADDLRVFVRSERAAQRVFDSVCGVIERRLRMKVNREKSSIRHAADATLLGFGFCLDGPQVTIRVAPKAIKRLKGKLRILTRRSWGVSMEYRIGKINRFTTGWMGFFVNAEPILTLFCWLKIDPLRGRWWFWLPGCGGGWRAGAVGAGSAGVSVQGDDVGVVDEAVDGRGGGDVVAEGFSPANWNWLRFRMMVLAFDLLVSVSGVSS
jgi:hypothetical protein